MAQDYSQVNFRIPTKLKEKIESSAIENNRSITSELVSRLEDSYASNLVASDPYKRMLLANIAMIVANETDKPSPSFSNAIERITKAIMVDEKQLFDTYKDIKKAP